MNRVANELIVETLLFLKRGDIENNQEVCKKWNIIIQQHASLLPMRVLKSIEICSLDFGDVRDDNVKYAVIESPKSKDKIWITSGGLNENKIIASLKNYVAEKFIMDGVNFPTIQFVKQLKFICESRIKAIEYHSRGWYQANAAVLASYIDAVRVFLSMNEYEMRTLFRSSSSTLRQIPDSVAHVELNFQQFYESSYTDEFVPFLIQNPLNNGDNYTIILRGFEDFARRVSYIDFVDLCDQILRAYENSKTPKNMVQKIILDNLGICISQNFMRTRKYKLTNLYKNDFNTVEIYEVKLTQNCSITLLFQRIFEGETSYRVTFEVKY